MKILQTSSNIKISLFSSSQEMPAKRYNVFNKYMLYDSGIGSDMEAISSRFQNLHSFLAGDRKDDAIVEAENLHYCFYGILHNADFTTLSFACLVHSIGDTVCSDLTEDGLNAVKELLYNSEITVEQVQDYLDEFKKKVRDELSSWFPRVFTDQNDMEFYAQIARRIDFVAQRAELPEGTVSEELNGSIAAIDAWLLEQRKPNIFRANDEDNCIDNLEREFSAVAAAMENEGTTRPMELSLYEWYGKLDYLQRTKKPS